MAEKHYGETKTVLTKKELDEALNGKYGKICVTGDLLKDIEEDFKKKTEKSLLGISGFFGFGLLLGLPFVGAGSLLAYALGAGAFTGGGSFLKNKKALPYSIRPDISNNPKELWILHKTEIDKIREQYKGLTNATADNFTQLDDMIAMNVRTIHIKKDAIDPILKEINDSKVFKKKADIHDITSYEKYRIIEDAEEYRFTKIE